MKKSLMLIKVVSSILFSIIFLSCKSVPVKEDIDELETILTRAWVNYDEEAKNGFNIKKVKREINLHYNLSKNSHFWKKDKSNYVINNGVDNWAMTYATTKVLHKYVKTDDSHFCIVGEKNGGYLFPTNYFYYANIFFQKSDDKYFVISSDNPDIQENMPYTGSSENLFKTIYNGQEAYVFGLFNKYNQQTSKISINNKDYEINITCNNVFHKFKNTYMNCIETEDSIYVSLSDMDLGILNKTEYEKNLNIFEDICKKAENGQNKKNIIIDLRGNNGGYVNFGQDLLASLLYGDNKSKRQIFYHNYNVFESGAIYLHSDVIAKARYNKMAGNTGFSDTSVKSAADEYAELNASKARYYSGLERLGFAELPQLKNSSFKGKIYILMDSGTASASEEIIALSYFDDKDSVVLIGENTNGCIDFGGIYKYELPNSKTCVTLCSGDYRTTSALKSNSHWHGDKSGFHPDYWTTDSNTLETLIYLTKDESLKTALADLDKELK